MRILLDTQIALWAVTASPKLGSQASAILLDSANEILVSAVSIWEISIKHRKNPKVMPVSPNAMIDACVESGFGWLDVNVLHARTTGKLPLLHVDPFDRLLVAQAIEEPVTLLTRDATLCAYTALVRLV
jgi:PIN domain nuclease of toxin-antitoxin system